MMTLVFDSAAMIGPGIAVTLLVLLGCRELLRAGAQPLPRRWAWLLHGLIAPLLLLFLISAAQRLVALMGAQN